MTVRQNEARSQSSHIFGGSVILGGKEQIGAAAYTLYYAYRNMTAVKMVFVFCGGGQRTAGAPPPVPVATCL